MTNWRKVVAVLFWLLAGAVAMHFVFTPFYEDATDVGLVWRTLNWFMAVGVLAALMVHYLRKRTLDSRRDDGTITQEYLEVNLALYASAVLSLWYFWNWFDALTVDADPQSDIRLIIWAFVDPLLVVISAVTGRHLWQYQARRQEG